MPLAAAHEHEKPEPKCYAQAQECVVGGVCGLGFVVCGLGFVVCDSSKTATHLAATCAIGWSLSSASLTQIQNASSHAMAARLLAGVGAWWRWWWW
jgi:hypothetical protein